MILVSYFGIPAEFIPRGKLPDRRVCLVNTSEESFKIVLLMYTLPEVYGDSRVSASTLLVSFVHLTQPRVT